MVGGGQICIIQLLSPFWLGIDSQPSFQTKTSNFENNSVIKETLVALIGAQRRRTISTTALPHHQSTVWLLSIPRFSPLHKTEKCFFTPDFIILGCAFLGFVALKHNMTKPIRFYNSFCPMLRHVKGCRLGCSLLKLFFWSM